MNESVGDTLRHQKKLHDDALGKNLYVCQSGDAVHQEIHEGEQAAASSPAQMS